MYLPAILPPLLERKPPRTAPRAEVVIERVRDRDGEEVVERTLVVVIAREVVRRPRRRAA